MDREILTIGSPGTGRADISTVGSGPIPGAFRVQDTALSDTHVIYFVRAAMSGSNVDHGRTRVLTASS